MSALEFFLYCAGFAAVVCSISFFTYVMTFVSRKKQRSHVSERTRPGPVPVVEQSGDVFADRLEQLQKATFAPMGWRVPRKPR